MTRNIRVVQVQRDWAEHTLQVTVAIEGFRSAFLEAETSVRGYALSPDPGFLETYNSASQQVVARANEIGTLAVDNPEQQARMTRVRSVWDERQQGLRQLIKAAESKDKDFTDLVTVGKSRGDEIRGLLNTMESAEQALLAQRTTAAKASLENAVYSFLGGSALTLMFVVATFLLARQQLTEQSREAWLRAQAARLSQQTRGVEDVERFGRTVLDWLSAIISVPLGGFFLRDKDSFRAAAGVALPESAKQLVIPMGQGLLGEAAVNQEIFVANGLAPATANLTSALHESRPTHLTILPIVFQMQTLAVLELTSLQPWPPVVLELLRNVREGLGVSLQSVVSRSQLQMLLKEAQAQSEELQTQQEKLRQTNEELEQQSQALVTQQRLATDQNRDLLAAKNELEERARQLSLASRYKTEFLANMSHELRTPLNSLLILSTLLSENRPGTLNEEQVGFARTIYNAGNDLLTLVNDILDLAKIESGAVRLEIEEVVVADVIDSLRRVYAPTAGEKGLEFSVQMGLDRATAILTDRLRLEQIMRNFLSNAIKFTEKGKIEMKAGLDGEARSLVLSVTDTGIGVSSEQLEHIFEAFQQADGTTSRKYGGTGLGLTISRELAGLLQGRIDVQSEKGKGSTFTLILPLTAGAQIAQGAAASTRYPAKSSAEMPAPTLPCVPDAPFLLIVEDDVEFGQVLAGLATQARYKPVLVRDGESALAVVDQRIPTGILLDVRLPTLSGLAVLERLKADARTRHIPVHMISGVDYTFNALRLGAMGYLVKPASKEHILEALDKISNLLSRDVKRTLVIEDDEVQRNSLTRLIESPSVKCEAVASGAEGLAEIEKGIYDCVILDLNLRDMSGFELLRTLEGKHDVVLPPVVVYTSKDLTRREEEELRRYSESIILKGALSPERLMDEVGLFLHHLDARKDLPLDTEAASDADAVFRGRRILLADDDMRNTFALMSALEPLGVSVVIARNGLEAIAELEKDPAIDLLLIDLMMPEMDGLTALVHLRADRRFQELPIIALTARAMKEDQERCLEAGANDYLSKPFKLEHLFSLLRVWLPRKIVGD